MRVRNTQPNGKKYGVRNARLLSLLLVGALSISVFVVASSAGATKTRTATPPWLAKIDAAYQNGIAPITTWSGPKTSVAASSVKGPKSFVVIPCSVAATGCAVQADGFVEAAHKLGWKTTLIDGKGDPNVQNSAVQQAITLHADGIFEVSIDPHILSASIKAANKAGIPVIAGATGTGPTLGLAHEVSLYGPQEGTLMGDAIVALTKGNAHVAIFNDSEFQTVNQRVTATLNVLKQCPTCKVVVNQDIPVTSLGQALIARVQSVLQAHPDINVIWSGYDAAAANMVTAVQQSGDANKVWVGSFNGLPQNIDFIRKGIVEKADIGEALTWEGWAAADDFLRIFAGQKPVASDGVPHQILVKSSLPAPGAATQNWNSDFNFKAKYLQLWGLTK
jgi:ribose transport system substrate-binding protein